MVPTSPTAKKSGPIGELNPWMAFKRGVFGGSTTLFPGGTVVMTDRFYDAISRFDDSTYQRRSFRSQDHCRQDCCHDDSASFHLRQLQDRQDSLPGR
jgi:hypothetical protein